MFTGIVEEVGMVSRLERQASRARLGVACRRVLSDAALGSSIAVDGCCLTVSKLTDHGFEADLMLDTLTSTVLGDLSVDDPVNLERPLAAGGRFGGHLVQGHVDGVGTVVGREEHPGSVLLRVAASTTITPYLARKGSIALQGVSLTIADIDPRDGTFRVGLIPHTCEATTLGRLAVGDRVNLEADIVAKYLQELLNRTAEEAAPRHRGPVALGWQSGLGAGADLGEGADIDRPRSETGTSKIATNLSKTEDWTISRPSGGNRSDG